MGLIKVIIVMALLFLALGIYLNLGDQDMTEEQEQDGEKLYEGPVRPTDNLSHFRKTGETKPLNNPK